LSAFIISRFDTVHECDRHPSVQLPHDGIVSKKVSKQFITNIWQSHILTQQQHQARKTKFVFRAWCCCCV